jgi:hypothetical protein
MSMAGLLACTLDSVLFNLAFPVAQWRDEVMRVLTVAGAAPVCSCAESPDSRFSPGFMPSGNTIVLRTLDEEFDLGQLKNTRYGGLFFVIHYI